jgi:hypothetical protein
MDTDRETAAASHWQLIRPVIFADNADASRRAIRAAD